MSQRPAATLAGDLAAALSPHHGRRARALAAALTPVLLQIARGELGAASLHRCLAEQRLGVELMQQLAGQDFRAGDYRITFRKGNMLGFITFEDLAHNNVMAILIREIVPSIAPPLPASEPALAQRYGWPLAGSLVGLVVGLAIAGPAGDWLNRRPTLVGQQGIATLREQAATPTLAPLKITTRLPTSAAPPPPRATPAPAGPTAPPLVAVVEPVPSGQGAPLSTLLAPGAAMEAGGWSLAFPGPGAIGSFRFRLGDISQEHLTVTLLVSNRAGATQPFPLELIALSSTSGNLSPDPELSERYGRADGTVRILGLDPIPSDGLTYSIMLAFDIPPEAQRLFLYAAGPQSAGWFVR